MGIPFRRWFCRHLGWFCPKPTPLEPPPPIEYVAVIVCKISGGLPNKYCPETEKRMYLKGMEPKMVCVFHQSPPPPPPPPALKKLLFIGAYDYLCATGNHMLFLARGRDAQASGWRIFADCQWKHTGTQPYEYADYDEVTAQAIRYKDPNDIKDIRNINGKLTIIRESGARFPLYDYTRPYRPYWDAFRWKMGKIKEYDMMAWIAALDYCTLKQTGDDKYFSPWICAKQRMMPGVQNGTWGEQMKPWIAAWYSTLIGVLKDIGVKFIIEDMNEGWAISQSEDFVLAWFKWSNAELRKLVPKEQILTTVGGVVGDEIAKLCGYKSPHGYVRPDRVPSSFVVPAEKIIISGDGGTDGNGRPDFKGKRGVSEDDAEAIAHKIIEYGYAGTEVLDRGLWRNNNDRANLDTWDDGPTKRMAQVFL